MIIYSIIPAEVVFSRQDSGAIEEEIKEIEYLGEKVQVSPLTNNRSVIRRIISTNPGVYLNPLLQPGTIIEYRES